MKLVARREKAAVGFIRALDDVIHSLVTDERFQVYKNTATDKDVHWLYEHSKEMEKLDSYFSASGIITFKNSLDLQKTFTEIPNNRILVETDSPFLAPFPMRGKKNEPSFIKYTIKKLADLKNEDEKNMINITSKNFENLFFNK